MRRAPGSHFIADPSTGKFVEKPQSTGATMNWEQFFARHRTTYEEDRYQAFKARFLHELAQARAAAAEREEKQHEAIMGEIDPLGQG